MPRRLTRRRLLQTVGGVSLTAVAGCLSDDSDDSSTPGDTPTPVDAAEIPYDVAVDHDLSDWDQYDEEWSAPETAPGSGFETEVLAENLEIPWDLAFAPSGELFVTERTGRILTVTEGDYKTVAAPEDIIDAEALEPGSEEDSWLVEGGEGGLLGIAVHPTYPDPPLVYTYFTVQADGERTNRVVAFDTSAENPAEESWPIVEGIPGHTYHNGGRITFGPANYLWIATGDGDPAIDNPERIADPGVLGGKILRVEPDGTAPEDNPDIAGGDPRVYTYGHRNPQGIVWLPDGTPVISEHGPGGGDEVNVLRAGENYGWPYARDGDDFESYEGTDYQPPVASASSWAPSGSLFYTGDAVPSLQGRMLVGGLISQQLNVVTIARDESRLADGHATHHDADWLDSEYYAASTPVLADALGRIRHVEQGPDGGLYAVTSNRDGRASGRFPTERDDVLVKITPK